MQVHAASQHPTGNVHLAQTAEAEAGSTCKHTIMRRLWNIALVAADWLRRLEQIECKK